VTIPETVGAVNRYAFTGCSSLVDVTCLAATPPSADDDSFDQSTYTSATLHVPGASLNDYKAATCWKKFTAVEGIFRLGDVNKDGYINVADVTTLISAVLNNTPVDMDVADVNEDTFINVADVTRLITIVLNN
jgi:hypothetical protein